MSCTFRIVWVLLLLAACGQAAAPNLCNAVSSTSDVQFKLGLPDGRVEFQEGEVIPLTLSFTSSSKALYRADERSYDRSGRLASEEYCVSPEAPDPLAAYFKTEGGIGGGVGGVLPLGSAPFLASADLNEWRTLAPGHYRVSAVSYRVWRVPDANDKTGSSRTPVVLHSNTVEIDVKPADPGWQLAQIQNALTVLADAGRNDVRDAARTLRFLNSQESTRQLARLFEGLNQPQSIGWDLMFGLYGSSYRNLAIESMREQLTAPDHPVTSQFLRSLLNLEINSDPAWDPDTLEPNNAVAARAFWQRRRAHEQALAAAEAQTVISALDRKGGAAHAETLHALMVSGGVDRELARKIRPQLIADWDNLPAETQRSMIQYGWSAIAGPEMLPVLRRLLDQPAPPVRTADAATRDAVLKDLYELDPTEGRAAILRDVLNPTAHPSVDVVKLLPQEDTEKFLPPAVDRIRRKQARDLDYALVDRYAGPSELETIGTVFEASLGRWSCEPQVSMLRYFLRVEPEYGSREVSAALGSRSQTQCFKYLLTGLGDRLPQAQASAIRAMDDPDIDLALNAVEALGRWGTADAEAPLWARLRRFHQQWTGREGEPDHGDPGGRAMILEQRLVAAIAAGRSWICPPDKLAQLEGIVLTEGQRQQVAAWVKQWNEGPSVVLPIWLAARDPTFSILQYVDLTVDELRAKLAQFPRGTELRWQFWQPGQVYPPVTMAVQDGLYKEMRSAAAENEVILTPADHP